MFSNYKAECCNLNWARLFFPFHDHLKHLKICIDFDFLIILSLFHLSEIQFKLMVTFIRFLYVCRHFVLVVFKIYFLLLFLADGKCSLYFWAVVLSKSPSRLSESCNNHWKSQTESTEGKCYSFCAVRSHVLPFKKPKESISYVNLPEYLKEDTSYCLVGNADLVALSKAAHFGGKTKFWANNYKSIYMCSHFNYY